MSFYSLFEKKDEKFSIENKYESMNDEMVAIRNLFIKCNFTKSSKDVLRVQEQLFNIKEREKAFLLERYHQNLYSKVEGILKLMNELQ